MTPGPTPASASGGGAGPGEARAYTVVGRVQGVGFRAFVRHTARELGLAGWVRNQPDGSVAIEAWGDGEVLGRFEDRLRVGPPASRVERLTVRPVECSFPTDRFEVRF